MTVWAIRCEMGAPEEFWVVDGQVYLDPEKAKTVVRGKMKEQDEKFTEHQEDGHWLLDADGVIFFLEKLGVVE